MAVKEKFLFSLDFLSPTVFFFPAVPTFPRPGIASDGVFSFAMNLFVGFGASMPENELRKGYL